MRIAKESEGTAMEIVGSCLGYDENLTTTEVSVFCVEAAGEYTELSNRIKVRYNARRVIEGFFHRTSVDEKAIGCFSLSADRHIARIQISGRRSAGTARHHHGIGLRRTCRNDSCL